MCQAISAVYRVDEAKDIRDQAIALEMYARQAHNVEAERQACEIRLRAERRAGQLSAKLERSNPGSRKKDLGGSPPPKSKVLKDAGISKDQGKQWERLAAVPDEKFDAALADRTMMPTTAGIIRANADPPKRKITPVSTEALWLWGMLREFSKTILPLSVDDALETMPPEMRDDIHTLAPRVAAWLRQVGGLDNGKQENKPG